MDRYLDLNSTSLQSLGCCLAVHYIDSILLHGNALPVISTLKNRKPQKMNIKSQAVTEISKKTMIFQPNADAKDTKIRVAITTCVQ